MPAKRFGASILIANRPVIIAVAEASDTTVVVSFFNKNAQPVDLSLALAFGSAITDVKAEDWIIDGFVLGSKELFETRPIAVEEQYILVAKSSLSNVNCTAYGFENQIEEEIL